MPKTTRREDSEQDDTHPKRKFIRLEMDDDTQNALISGLISTRTTPENEMLRSITLETLRIENIDYVDFPNWVYSIRSLKEILFYKCTTVVDHFLQPSSFYSPISSVRFSGCKRVFLDSLFDNRLNIEKLSFESCKSVSVLHYLENRALSFKEIEIINSSCKSMDWLESAKGLCKTRIEAMTRNIWEQNFFFIFVWSLMVNDSRFRRDTIPAAK